MTEPTDEPVVASSATPLEPPQEPSDATAPMPPHEQADTPPPPQPAPAEPELPATADPEAQVPPAPVWIPPEGGGRGRSRRGCCLILAVVGALVAIVGLLAVVGLIYLGAQVRDLQGTVKFEAGTATTGCLVREPATTFPASSTIHFVATFTRPVTADETIGVVVTFPDGTARTTDSAYKGGGICVSDTLDPGLDAGSWTIQFRSGTEVLATGSFVVTP